MKNNYNSSRMIFEIDHINTGIFYNEKYLFNNKLMSKIYGKTIVDGIKYKEQLNNNGFRCDNFINDHKELHILFSGCSVSFGSGLEFDEVWTKKLFDKINHIKKCSGYFNLSFPGTGLPNQIMDIFKYCHNYGNPNYIFYSVPSLERFYYYNKDHDSIGDAFYNQNNDSNYRIIELLYYQYYYMLDQYCSSNKIKLIAFTWSESELDSGLFDKVGISSFKSFNIFNKEKMKKYILKYCEKNKHDRFVLKARDNDHFGTAYHDFWAQEIFSIIENDLI